MTIVQITCTIVVEVQETCTYSMCRRLEKMVLTTNEKLLKTYDYGEMKIKASGRKETLPCNLTITNKRIISGETQIAMNEVAGVSASVGRIGQLLPAIIAFVIAAVVLLVGSLGNVGSKMIYFIVFGAMTLVMGTIFLFLKKRKVTIKIYSKASMVVDMVNLDAITKKPKIKSIKIKINKEADAMVSEIGDLIAEYSKVYAVD